LVDIDEPSEDKNDSEMCNFTLSEEADMVITELNSMRGKAKQKIEQLIEILRTKDKLKDHEIKKVLFTKVDFVSRKTIYNALPQELKREYTKAEPLPKTINVAHKVIDVPSESRERSYTVNFGSQDEPKSDALGNDDEDPKDTEIQFLKEQVKELEEAHKQVQQFIPATQLENKPNPQTLTDDTVFNYLKDRAKETGDIIDFGRVGSGALVQALAQYKNSFGVVELFGRIVKK
jgi:hypothetical protein